MILIVNQYIKNLLKGKTKKYRTITGAKQFIVVAVLLLCHFLVAYITILCILFRIRVNRMN